MTLRCEDATHRYGVSVYFDREGNSPEVTCVCGALTVRLATQDGEVRLTGRVQAPEGGRGARGPRPRGMWIDEAQNFQAKVGERPIHYVPEDGPDTDTSRFRE